MDKKVYDSAVKCDALTITAPYYNAIKDTKVFFEQEKIAVTMNSLGHIAFFNAQEELLGVVDVPVSKDPSKYAHTAQYGQVRCTADGKAITLFLPVYWWGDSYPDCDGEYDRWTRYIDYWFRIVFDCESQQISIFDR